MSRTGVAKDEEGAARTEATAIPTLDDALHELSQPLTALSILVDLALLRDEPEAWQEALRQTHGECRRAVAALEAARSAAEASVLVSEGDGSAATRVRQ